MIRVLSARYRQLVRVWHPDKRGREDKDEATAKFARIQWAWFVRITDRTREGLTEYMKSQG